jgi:cell division septation protein DedD
MKRLILVLLGGLLINSLCMAQAKLGNFSQRGKASQDMETAGLRAAHPSLPLGSKARVTNPVNGKEIEVTIAARIPASADRIVDLSADAARSLELAAGGGTVVVSVPGTPRVQAPPPPAPPPPEPEPIPVVIEEPPPPPEPDPVPVVAEVPPPLPPPPPEPDPVPVVVEEPPPPPPPPPVVEAVAAAPVPETKAEPPLPVNIIINNYMQWPEDAARPAVPKGGQAAGSSSGINTDQDFLAWLALMALEAQEARESREARSLQEAREAREVQAKELREARETREAAARIRERSPTPQSAPETPAPAAPPPAAVPPVSPPVNPVPPPRTDVQIIGIPDRTSSRLYYLQVGAFSTLDGASAAFHLVRAAGFEAVQEQSGAYYRVFAAGVSGANIHAAAQRLGAMGFKQVWVKE